MAKRSNDLVSLLPQFGLRFLTVASDVIYLVIIPILAFFFLKDGKGMRAHILEIVDRGPRRELLDEILADIDLLLAHYMRALFGVIACGLYGIQHLLLDHGRAVWRTAGGHRRDARVHSHARPADRGRHYSRGSGHCRLACAGDPDLPADLPHDAGLCALSPLDGERRRVAPAADLFGVFAGAEIAGIAGTFLSVPVLALVRILYLRLRKSRLTTHMA